PPGYSYLLAGLELAGIGNAWSFAALNLVFILIGNAASYYVLRQELRLDADAALVVCSMTLLSFLFVKYGPVPIAESVYFGLTMITLALLVRFQRSPTRPVLLLASAIG